MHRWAGGRWCSTSPPTSHDAARDFWGSPSTSRRDDTAAEVVRLVAAGAEAVERIDDWTVLRDPAGVLFGMVPADPDGFAEVARTVGDEAGR